MDTRTNRIAGRDARYAVECSEAYTVFGVSAPYSVTWVYPDGNPSSKYFGTFPEALSFLRDSWLRTSGAHAYISGDGCEHDGERWNDGLTDKEREQL
jgi:hypothetical protein